MVSDEPVTALVSLSEAQTFLRLDTTGGSTVAYNDDACSGLLSHVEYVVPWGINGTHQLRAGCWASGRTGPPWRASCPPSPPGRWTAIYAAATR